MRRTAIAPRGRRGFALMLVLAQLTLISAIWLLSNRQTGSLLLLEAALGRRAQRDAGSLAALARGVGLLETGTPTTDDYDCEIVLDTPEGAVSYTVSYSKLGDEAGGATRWSVSASRTTEGENPPEMPSTFGP